MKLLVLFSLIFVALADHEIKVRLDLAEQWDSLCLPFKSECIKESGVKEELVNDLFVHGHFSDEHTFKCYMKCLDQKLNLMNENGQFTYSAFQNSVKGADLDIIEEIISKVESEKDLCEKAYLFLTKAASKLAERYPFEHPNYQNLY